MRTSNTEKTGSTRRDLLKAVAAGAAVSVLPRWARAAEPPPRKDRRPNIVYIFTDQQHSKMMSCAGNQWLKTPAMDYLAANGTRFERAYTTNPVCVPARIGMMTGHMPGDFGNRDNRDGFKPTKTTEDYARTNIAARLKKAGYDLAYGGKTHLPKPLDPGKSLGFENFRDFASYIKRQHDKPYYLVASFLNPHDICYMAIEGMAHREGKSGQKALKAALTIPEGVSREKFFAELCPPLPPNYEPEKDEPKAIKWLLDAHPFRRQARENYTDEDWRLHRWAYCRLTEMVDRQIQVVLNAIKDSGQEDNTIVIFSSDHGDNDASHRMEHKSVLYEESTCIPFIVMDKTQPGGRVDKTHLVSNGLDLLPTVLDYAGVPDAKGDPRGNSVRPLVEGREVPWRKDLAVECQIGRMVVSDRYRYIRYDRVGIEECLHDFKEDPWETRHFTKDPSHADALAAMLEAFRRWFPQV